MEIENLRATLSQICRQHILPQDARAVIREPYIPYIPGAWNRDLILAEAQNLSVNSNEYIADLEKRSAEDRIRRLYLFNYGLGIGPWDDDTMKLAYEAAFGQRAEDVAVSNGVLWSEQADGGQNKNPSDELIKLSSRLWAELLHALNPERIITCGKIALSVIQQIPGLKKPIAFRSPSPTALSRTAGMFSMDDLLNRYPEVANLRNNREEWFKGVRWGNSEHNKIFFACHAVSISSGQKSK